ncbi:hypothetical protein [Streptomyces himalayensis]|nr:hypothetical protein [Streptomyces himalayensis]
MAGWDATVLTRDHSDPRPLRILGARAAGLESALTAHTRGPGPQAIAVDAGLFGSDARVRRMVLEALQSGVADVRLWGDQWPSDLKGGVGSMQHRLSVAARAFKAQALAAAAAPVDEIGVTEVFWSGERLHASTRREHLASNLPPG